MDGTERFKVVMDILKENNLSNCPHNHNFFYKLNDEELNNENKIVEIVQKIKAYEKRLENNPNKYPEYIMRYMRQSLHLDEYDTSKDDIINEMSPDEIFDRTCTWNGLLGSYSDTIKDWVDDIYGINVRENRRLVVEGKLHKGNNRIFIETDVDENNELVGVWLDEVIDIGIIQENTKVRMVIY